MQTRRRDRAVPVASFDRLAKAGWQFSIGVRITKPVAVALVAETA